LARFDARICAALACCLLVLGSKLGLIEWFGTSTPFWDEWSALGTLFKNFLNGDLHPADLLAAYNEHRILLTRLVALGLFEASGYWDPGQEMIVNAAIHSVVTVMIAASLARILDREKFVLVVLLTGLLGAIPFGWENTLMGFNTHFYLLIGLSMASLLAVSPAAAWSARWWAGTALAIGSFFCLASGALTTAAAAGLCLLQILRGVRSGRREWLGVLAHIGLTVGFVLATPNASADSPFPLQAQGLDQFLHAFGRILSWPSKSELGLILYVPTLLFAWRLLGEAPDRADKRWFNLAVLGWLLLQFMALAYGRADLPLSSRYLDIIQIGIVLNGVSALFLLSAFAETVWQRRWAVAALVCWFVVLIFGLQGEANHSVGGGIEFRRDSAAIETENIRAYLHTGDFSILADKPPIDISFPSAERLRGFLDDPTIRAILPVTLIDPERPRPRQAAARAVKHAILDAWSILMIFGLGFFVASPILLWLGRGATAGKKMISDAAAC
jgi:hypothetical protein